MTSDDRIEIYTLVNGLYNAHGKTCTPAGLGHWWEALQRLSLDDVQRAFAKVAQTGEDFPNPARIRRLAMSLVASDAAAESLVSRCHFHGDGRWEPGGVGRPDEPSRNPTASWCDRCRHFVALNMQAPEVTP